MNIRKSRKIEFNLITIKQYKTSVAYNSKCKYRHNGVQTQSWFIFFTSVEEVRCLYSMRSCPVVYNTTLYIIKSTVVLSYVSLDRSQGICIRAPLTIFRYAICFPLYLCSSSFLHLSIIFLSFWALCSKTSLQL